MNVTSDARALSGPGFAHDAWLFDGDQEFLTGVVAILAASEESCAVVLAPAERLATLRDAGVDHAAGLQLVDVDEVARNPARSVSVWLEALEAADGGPVVGVGELAYAGRDAAALEEVARVDGLLAQLVEPDQTFHLTCAYDTGTLSATQLGRAWEHHGDVVDDPASGDLVDQVTSLRRPSDGVMLPPPADAVMLKVTTMEDLTGVREAVLAAAETAGLSRQRQQDAALAANELAANSVRHGGGTGELRVWIEGGMLYMESLDGGSIDDPLVGLRRPSVMGSSGRGLWIVNQVADLVRWRSSDEGLRTRVRFQG